MSDYRVLDKVNEWTLVVETPDGKTKWINVNNAKPVSARPATDNDLQDFKLSAMRKEHTHPYMLQSSTKYIYKATKQEESGKPRKQWV